MKFEFCSRFRNRNKNPDCGNFEVKISQTAHGKNGALDPVCRSAPMISWKGGFVLSGIIVSSMYSSRNLIEHVVDLPVVLEQYKIPDFLTGCQVTCFGFTFNCSHSTFLENSNSIIIKTLYEQTFAVGSVITIKDYTNIASSLFRAPTSFDFSKFAIIYNETVNDYAEIINCDMETRRLTFKPKSFLAWADTDNFNLRDQIPEAFAPFGFITPKSVTSVLILNPSYVGDWVRFRLPDYSLEPQQNSWTRQIIQVVGNSITFYPPLLGPLPIAGDIEILPFSFDNSHPMQYYEKYQTNDYFLTLEALSIPNIPYYNINLISEPYLYVTLYNTDSSISFKNLINTNNPYVSDSMWIAKLDPTTTESTFLKFNICATLQEAQKLWFDLKVPQVLDIRNQNGMVLKPIQNDTQNPQPTWPDLNISAVLSIVEWIPN